MFNVQRKPRKGILYSRYNDFSKIFTVTKYRNALQDFRNKYHHTTGYNVQNFLENKVQLWTEK